MAPKKNNKKKGNDDWEAELGESIAPAAAPATPDADANGDEEAEAGGGGLMNLMRKRKEKRKNKGQSEDFVEGEDPPAADGDAADNTTDFAAVKAPEEANPDDEFALPDKKNKGGKGKQAQAKAAPADKQDDAGDDTAEGGRVLTKAEKEKLKKEREKQRKKEQVR